MKERTRLTIMISFLTALTFVSSAQPTAGTFTLGGEVSFDFENNEVETGSVTVDRGNTNRTTLTPTFGYFFIDGLAGGINFSYTRIRRENDANTETNINRLFTIGPFIKYYHTSGFFGMGRIGFGSQKDRTDFADPTVTDTETDRNATEWRLGAGYAHFFNEYISVEPMISYGGTSLNNDETDTRDINNSFRFSVAFALFFDQIW